jgi:two-component system, LytTR family, response regulator
MYKAILVDDERLARMELRRVLDKVTSLDISEAGTYEEAVTLIDALQPDVIFLDIQLNGKYTGFDVLDNIESVPLVIFTTAFDEYAIKAFEKNAIDYLLKPIELDRLQESVQKMELILRGKQKNNSGRLGLLDHVFVKEGNSCWFVQLQEIRYLERINNYTRVYFGNNSPLILKSLSALEERLDDKNFFRANRKTIINIKMIEKINTIDTNIFSVTLMDGTVIELSRRQSVLFKDIMSF